jgi:hypothetical protein
VSVGGREVATVPLRAAHAVEKASVIDKASSFVADDALWFALALALSAILIAAVILRRRTR